MQQLRLEQIEESSHPPPTHTWVLVFISVYYQTSGQTSAEGWGKHGEDTCSMKNVWWLCNSPLPPNYLHLKQEVSERMKAMAMERNEAVCQLNMEKKCSQEMEARLVQTMGKVAGHCFWWLSSRSCCSMWDDILLLRLPNDAAYYSQKPWACTK